MKRIIIFDFDDTLIDNRLSDYQGFIIPCKELGIKSPSKKKIFKLRKEGYLAKDIAKQIVQNKKEVKDFLEIRRNFINATKSNKFFRLKRNTKKILEYLKNENVTCIICSVRKNDEIIENFLVKKKVSKYFAEIHLTSCLNLKIQNNSTANRTIIKIKLIKNILKKYPKKYNKITFIGNAEEDLKAAKETKTKFIFYKNSYMPIKPKIKLEGIIKTSSMKELQKIIDEREK